VSSTPDVQLLLGMLMFGMALLTHIRHKAQTARIVQKLTAKFGFKAESDPQNCDPTSNVRVRISQ